MHSFEKCQAFICLGSKIILLVTLMIRFVTVFYCNLDENTRWIVFLNKRAQCCLAWPWVCENFTVWLKIICLKFQKVISEQRKYFFRQPSLPWECTLHQAEAEDEPRVMPELSPLMKIIPHWTSGLSPQRQAASSAVFKGVAAQLNNI